MIIYSYSSVAPSPHQRSHFVQGTVLNPEVHTHNWTKSWEQASVDAHHRGTTASHLPPWFMDYYRRRCRKVEDLNKILPSEHCRIMVLITHSSCGCSYKTCTHQASQPFTMTTQPNWRVIDSCWGSCNRWRPRPWILLINELHKTTQATVIKTSKKTKLKQNEEQT